MKRCGFCGLALVGGVVNAGGTVGEAHVACFVAWDRREEALEHLLDLGLTDAALELEEEPGLVEAVA